MTTRTLHQRLLVNHCPQPARAPVTQAPSGFTVVEVMISTVIFVIVVSATYGLLEVGRAGRLNTNQRWEVLQNVRIALNAVGRDALNAGVDYPNLGAMIPSGKLTLVGGANDNDGNPDFLTPVFAADNVNSVNGVMTDQVTFLYIDDSFNGGVSVPASAISAPAVTPTSVTIQNGYNNTPFSVGDIYLISGQNATALGMLTAKGGTNSLTFANTDPLTLNSLGANAAVNRVTPPASISRVAWVTYWVADQDGNGTGTGTLMRRVYGGFNQATSAAINWTDQPLAFGIENMQIQYILADSRVVDSPAINQMQDIRQVRITVTVRSPDPDPKNIDPATRMPRPFRSTVTASFSTRNLVYEKL
jgi:prepilin-type N-terminal cleavage/methylation domain-containing protein